MKLVYSSIQIELTRRCNQNCLHCCRGDSEPLDLSNDTIDALFDNNDITIIRSLKFSGGEPTLNGGALEYLVNKIIDKKIEVNSYMLSINGTVYDDVFANTLIKLNDYCGLYSNRSNCNHGTLYVSQSQYHNKPIEEVVNKFSKLPFFIVPTGIEEIKNDNLLPYGNALKNNLTTKLIDINSITNSKSIEIVEYEGQTYQVFEYQYISSNGNVLNDGCLSYDMMDKYSVGNVNDQSITDMYKTKTLKYK